MKNYFEVFNLVPSFHIDLVQLRQTYYQLSKQSHPDHHQQVTNDSSDSSLLNQAYGVLSKQLNRIQYYLELLGCSEQSLKPNPRLLMEMMELNEEIENLNDAESQIQFKTKHQNRLEASFEALLNACQQFDLQSNSTHLEHVKNCYIEYKYLLRLQIPF